MISVYIITYNEELLLPFTINFYRKRFPSCHITVWDNESTDSTPRIAKENSCEVINYSTQNTLSDSMFLYIKNNCYKESSTDWVLICDCDEHLDIHEQDLLTEIIKGTTIIKAEAYHMINMYNNTDIDNIVHGFPDKNYDKMMLFNRRQVTINYTVGAHVAYPQGEIKFNDVRYKMYHYKYIGLDYLLAKYAVYRSRMSQENIDNHWGGACFNEDLTFKNQFDEFRLKSEQVLWK